MSRLSPLDPEQMSEQQRSVYERIVASRGDPAGPFASWLLSPEMADRAQALGEFARYRTVLGARLCELAILCVARFWDCPVEWAIHEPFARRAGLDDSVVEALRARREPPLEDERERAVYNFCGELLGTRRVSDDTYDAARRALGEQALVELTGVVGYYVLVAMTLNTFQTPLPAGVEAPFEVND